MTPDPYERLLDTVRRVLELMANRGQDCCQEYIELLVSCDRAQRHHDAKQEKQK